MKLWKIAIILVAIIGVSAGAYVGVSRSVDKKEAEQIEASGAGAFLEFDESDINKVTFAYDETYYDFSLEDSTWTCDNQSIKPNVTNIAYAVSTMSTLNTTKIIEKDASDLSIYGLDNPITITCSDGTNTYSLQIGNTSPTGESYYIKSTDDNDVYTITADDGLLLKIEEKDLKNRYIIDAYVYSLTKILYKEGDDVIFDCEKSDGTWNLIEPELSNMSVDLSKISSIADLLIRADVIDFIDNNPSDSDLAQYGLDNPKYTIQLATEDEERTVYFGDSPEDNVIYAQFDDTKEIVTFYMGEVGILGSGAEVVLNDTLYNDSQSNITNLKVDYQGSTYDIKVDYNSDDRTYTYSYGDKVITNEDEIQAVSLVVATSLNIPLYNMQLDAEPTGDPVLTITYTRNYEPTEYTLEFIPTDADSKYYYVLMDGEYLGCVVRNRALTADNQFLSCLEDFISYVK
jgi:hypothetical protein